MASRDQLAILAEQRQERIEAKLDEILALLKETVVGEIDMVVEVDEIFATEDPAADEAAATDEAASTPRSKRK